MIFTNTFEKGKRNKKERSDGRRWHVTSKEPSETKMRKLQKKNSCQICPV
jgi:hypothetical protein